MVFETKTRMSRNTKRKLPEEEVQRITEKLKSIKQKNVEEMRRLSKTALDALIRMEEIEYNMEEEARAVYPNYAREIRNCKVTFAMTYKEINDDCDGDEPPIETIRWCVEMMNEDSNATAIATTSSPADTGELKEDAAATTAADATIPLN